jgi:GxxExxY protein
MTRMGNMIHEQLSGAIIGIAMEVLNELKPGLDEVLYERAMVIELRRRGHTVAVQNSFPVFYQGELIGSLVPDLIVEESVISRPKRRKCVQRSGCRSDARIFEHRLPRACSPSQLQERGTRLETGHPTKEGP